MQEGDSLIIKTPGGGGYGYPGKEWTQCNGSYDFLFYHEGHEGREGRFSFPSISSWPSW